MCKWSSFRDFLHTTIYLYNLETHRFFKIKWIVRCLTRFSLARNKMSDRWWNPQKAFWIVHSMDFILWESFFFKGPIFLKLDEFTQLENVSLTWRRTQFISHEFWEMGTWKVVHIYSSLASNFEYPNLLFCMSWKLFPNFVRNTNRWNGSNIVRQRISLLTFFNILWPKLTELSKVSRLSVATVFTIIVKVTLPSMHKDFKAS